MSKTNVNINLNCLGDIMLLLQRQNKLLEGITMRLDELEGKLVALTTQLDKSRTEIVNAVNELQTELENVELPEGATNALNSLTAAVQGLDDLNPDAVVEPQPEA